MTVHYLPLDGPAFVEKRQLCSSPAEAAEILSDYWPDDREACYMLPLTVKHHLIGEPVLVSLGSIDHTFMSPREIFRIALSLNAAAILVAHNHPSGSPEPSKDDLAVTRRIARAADIIGIDLLDHLVVGEDNWRSIRRLNNDLTRVGA